MFLPPIKTPFPLAPIIPPLVSIKREILIIVHMIKYTLAKLLKIIIVIVIVVVVNDELKTDESISEGTLPPPLYSFVPLVMHQKFITKLFSTVRYSEASEIPKLYSNVRYGIVMQ